MDSIGAGAVTTVTAEEIDNLFINSVPVIAQEGNQLYARQRLQIQITQLINQLIGY